MAAPKKNLFQINLLIQKEKQFDLQSRLLKWVLTSGRYIVILVEVVVVAAFVYRYKLDADLANLDDKIKEEVPYIKSLKNDEHTILLTQFQLREIKLIKGQNLGYVTLLTTISSLTPKSIKISSVNIDRIQTPSQPTFSISGITPSNTELSAFIRALKSNPNFSNINLTNISFEGQTSFTIVGNIINSGRNKS